MRTKIEALIAVPMIVGTLACIFSAPSCITIRKVKRPPQKETPQGTEPLILEGPRRCLRHTLYFAAVLNFMGWWLLIDFTLLLFMALFFFLWFTLVMIPFQEKELRELFGEEYGEYTRAVPMFFPALRPKRRKLV